MHSPLARLAMFFLVHAEVTLPFYVHHDFNRGVKLRMCHLASLMQPLQEAPLNVRDLGG